MSAPPIIPSIGDRALEEKGLVERLNREHTVVLRQLRALANHRAVNHTETLTESGTTDPASDIVLADATAGNMTVTLSGAVDWKKRIVITKTDASANVIAVGELASGNVVLSAQNDTVEVFCDGDSYRAVGFTSGGGATGDVFGPASAIDADIAVFDGVTGKLIKDGGTTIAVILATAATLATAALSSAEAYTDAAIAALSAVYVPVTRTVTAGTGLTGGGALSANITLNVVAADTTISVTADAIAVGTITNANITSNTVAVAKLTAGTNGQVLATVTGATAWATPAGDVSGAPSAFVVGKINGASVPAAGSLTTGNVLQVTGASALGYAAVNLAGGAGYITGALPLANITAGSNGQALITTAGVPAWGNDFGAQDLTTTGAYISNSATPVLRLGLLAGSGAGAAAAAGPIRMSRSGGAGQETLMAVRNFADTADQVIIVNDSGSSAIRFGTGSWNTARFGDTASITILAGTQVNITTASVARIIVANALISIQPVELSFLSTVLTPIIGQADDNTAGVTAHTLTIKAQGVTGTGTIIGGPLLVKSGDASGSSTNATGGANTVRGGDASGGATTNVGGNLTLRPGNATGTGATLGTGRLQDGGATNQLTWDATGIAIAGAYLIYGTGGATVSTITMRGGIPTAGNGASLIFQATDGVGTNKSGGSITYKIGTLTGSGTVGSHLFWDSTGVTQLELVKFANARLVLALFRGANISATEMPANSGDGVVYVGNATTNPTADAVTGHTYYSDSAKPAWRFNSTNFRLNGTSATANTTGGGLTLPLLAAGYMDVQINGTQYKMPYYAA